MVFWIAEVISEQSDDILLSFFFKAVLCFPAISYLSNPISRSMSWDYCARLLTLLMRLCLWK